MTDKKKCGCGKSQDMPYCDGSHAIKTVLGGVIEQDTTIKLEEKDAPNKPDGLFETQYFTPSIEDIRVGYECEVKWSHRWAEFIYPAGGILPKEIRSVRVPYLTKEQIEKERWVENTKFFTKGDCGMLRYNNNMVIFKNSNRPSDWQPREYTLFRGECKDINTFRYICKLLGIN